MVLYLGPHTSGNLLEVVTVRRDDATEIVIHAMKMRRMCGPRLRRWIDIDLTREYVDVLRTFDGLAPDPPTGDHARRRR